MLAVAVIWAVLPLACAQAEPRKPTPKEVSAIRNCAAEYQDVWDAGGIALRNWIGRAPGQDQRLYKLLTEKKTVPPREAEAILQLLHDFGDDDVNQPETYDALIDYLGSERLSLRELAYWHLRRLVPAGRKIDYDPLAPKEKREAGIKAWRQLVPAGELPPKPGEK